MVDLIIVHSNRPSIGRSHYEKAVYNEFFGNHGRYVFIALKIGANTGGNVLDVPRLTAVHTLLNYVREHMNVTTDDGGSFNVSSACNRRCHLEKPLEAFVELEDRLHESISGQRYSPLLNVTVFGDKSAFAAISEATEGGVGDAFLIMHSWLRQLASGATGDDCMCARTLSDVGPSMTITSMTNGLAFLIGAITTSVPFLRTFCIVTDADKECLQQNNAIQTITYDNTIDSSHTFVNRALMSYSRCLTHPLIVVLVVVSLIVTVALSITQITQMQSTFSVRAALRPNSHFLHVTDYLDNEIANKMYVFMVFVNTPALGNRTNMHDYANMVDTLERLPHMHPNFTVDWLRRYTQFVDEHTAVFDRLFPVFHDDHPDEGDTVDLYEEFITHPVYAHYSNMITEKIINGRRHAVRNYFILFGHSLVDWSVRTRVFNDIRHVLDTYPHLNASAYSPDSHWYDLIEMATLSHNRVHYTLKCTAWPSVQAAVSTGMCMLPLALYDVYAIATTARAVPKRAFRTHAFS
ncbi:unnamed protein product [Sphagnum balticum]